MALHWKTNTIFWVKSVFGSMSTLGHGELSKNKKIVILQRTRFNSQRHSTHSVRNREDSVELRQSRILEWFRRKRRDASIDDMDTHSSDDDPPFAYLQEHTSMLNVSNKFF